MQVWACKGDRKGALEVTRPMENPQPKSSAAKIGILVLVLLST